MMKIFLLLVLIAATYSIKSPSAYCRVSPFPSEIPISMGEEEQFDLQAFISGYNLYFQANNSQHITLQTKYNVTEKPYGRGYDFVSAKIKENNRFIGLVSKGKYSGLAIGTNDEESGVTIQKYIQIEDQSFLQCFDIDQVSTRDNQVVIVDCAVILSGKVKYNEFLFVDLKTYKVVEESHYTDTFVNYQNLTKRRIEIVENAFFQIPYLIRFTLMDGVGERNKGQNYAEIFLMLNPLNPQLFDIIDHTVLQLDELSIADYQIHNDLIYILAYNKGIYQYRLTLDQHIVLRSVMPIKLDINRFRVDQLGFNDDLNVVATNGNTIYQFSWDVTHPPTLIAKYNLIPNSKVNQIFTDYNFVIASVDSMIDDQLQRRTWVFTRRTLTYLNAFNVFHAPPTSDVHIIHWEQHGRTLQIFHLYTSYNIKLSLPYVSIKLNDSKLIGKTQNFTVKALSVGDNSDQATCNVTFTFRYLKRFDNTIIKTGLWPRTEITVDSPDKREIPLTYEFFGLNLTYNAKFQTKSGEIPFAYNDKQHTAVINWPPEINASAINFFEMFSEYVPNQKQEEVFGLIQTREATVQRTTYRQYYIGCRVNLLDRDETHHLTCRTINSFKFLLGQILTCSQIFDPKDRRIAIIFDSAPHSIFVYFFWAGQLGFYGRKDYAGVATELVTGICIAQGKLFVVLQYGKRVQIYLLEDIYEPDEIVRPARPRMVLNSQIMRFFGVQYFAPVDLKVSRFHHEIIFLKTKTGIMVMNINEQSIPLLLYVIPTINIRYDFQVTENEILIINETETTIFKLQTPLRRNYPPLRKQSINAKFKIGEYDEVTSDRLFYIVGENSVYVINPRLYSTSSLYSEVWVKDPILFIDAVNVNGKEILFIISSNAVRIQVFAEEPKLFIEWTSNAEDFNMTLSASILNKTSQPYSLAFSVLKTNETVIRPTPAFNESQINKLSNFSAPMKNQSFTGDIHLNDSDWFQGTILRYTLDCQHCHKNITLINHIHQERQLIEARYIYDMESSFNGVYAQQYYSLFKTFYHNDSIHFINQIPTSRRGEVCYKIAVGEYSSDFVFSLCQVGGAVNVYVTSTVGHKPFTFGPYPTDARSVNHAKIVGNMLMIVDNDDDPFARAGGVYLYSLNFDFQDQDFISLMDYIDYADLQIEGFSGIPYIGSADLQQPYFFAITQQYRLFLTEARTGAIFIFSFEVSTDGEQIIYLSKKYIPLQKFIPANVKYPSPLRVLTINIHQSIQSYKEKITQYYLTLSVSNWHHMELMIKLDQNDEVLDFKLQRLFERFPWTLKNYFRYKRTRDLSTYFAVPYVDYENSRQTVMVYWIPFTIRQDALTYEQKYSKHEYTLLDGIPLLKAFGSHYVKDTYDTAFAFHNYNQDNLLFTDVDGYNITELSINRNLTIKIRDLPTSKEILNITARNSYNNYSFNINVNFYKDLNPDEQTKEEILWIVIIGIASLMIIGLLIAFVKQRHRLRQQASEDNKQTLLTVDEDFKNNYIDINRSSADIASDRQSMEPHILIKQKPETQ